MKVAACVIVRNEAPNFLEWLCFHLAVGFDTILVYDNQSNDGTGEVARQASTIGDVRLASWPSTGKITQLLAYRDAVKRHADEFDWIAFFDSDEFLFSPTARSIKDVLATLANAVAIGVHWQCFGSSGATALSGGLVIEEFLWRAETDFSANGHIKSILRPRAVDQVISAHVATLRHGAYVRANGREIHDFVKAGKTKHVEALDILRINHYYTRSREHYQLKLDRGNIHGEPIKDDFERMDRNEVYDDSALIYRDRVVDLVRSIDRATIGRFQDT